MQSNFIELDVAEIETVAGGRRVQHVATMQTTATMMHVPNKTMAASTRPEVTYDSSALVARLEGLR
jgi:hypothetical protein